MKQKLKNKQHVLEWLTTPPKNYKILWMKEGPPLIRTPNMSDEEWSSIRHQHLMEQGSF